MMNCSENMKWRHYNDKRFMRRVKRLFCELFLMGLLLGVLGMAIRERVNQPEAVEASIFVEPVVLTPEPDPEPVLLGNFRVTAYCPCEICCGSWANSRPDGIVYGAAGVELTPGYSAASPLPFGTVVEVEGMGEYVVQDRIADWVVDLYGDNMIDIFVEDHKAAQAFGLHNLNVYLKEGELDVQM